MNLMKYFNLKFLKENIKQAKGNIIFFTGILPLATIIYLIAKVSGNNFVYSFAELGIITFLLGFIVPIMIAYVFFGFMFKKKSVDFYLSQPINRKHIFLTNYFGGIVLNFLTIFLASIVLLIFSLTTSLVLPFSLLIDYFVFFLVSYLFMYSIATLAFSLSGNLVTSLVVVTLILCFTPFVKQVNRIFESMSTNTYVYCESDVCKNLSEVNENIEGYNKIDALVRMEDYNLTIPVAFTFLGKYQTRNVIYTIIVTVLFSILSYIAFNKRKMENNECSFKSNKVYYLVKSLTLMPFVLVCYLILINGKYNGWLVFIIITFIYSIIYDLITKKRIEKFILSSCLFVLTVVAFHIVYYAWHCINTKDVYLKNIDTISLSFRDYNEKEGNIKRYSNIVIDDKDVINDLLSLNLDYGNFYKQSYEVEFKSGNKIYSTRLSLPTEDTTIREYIKTKNIKEDNIKIDYNKIKALLINNRKYEITGELTKLLNEAKNNDVESINYTTLELYYYENHEVKEIEYVVGKSQELATYVSRVLNKEFLANLEINKLSYFGLINASRDRFDAFDYILKTYEDSAKEFVNYLNKHQDDEASDKYYFINMYPEDYKTYQYIINDVDSFDELYNKLIDDHKDDVNVQMYLKGV